MSDGADPQNDALIKYLSRSQDRCLSCDYSLKGLTSDRCPECGTALRLQLVPTSGTQSPWWWMATLGSTLSALLAVRLLLSLYSKVEQVAGNPSIKAMVDAGLASSQDLADWRILFFAAACCLVCTAMLAWLIARRRYFGTWERWQRVTWGVVGFLSPLLLIGAIFTFVDWIW